MIEQEGFRPVLDKDVMLDILADHVRRLSNKEQAAIAKSKGYQNWVQNVATRTFDYGYKIFSLTEEFSNGSQEAETNLYTAYAALLSEIYRESFDCAQFIPTLPENVKTFLQDAPSAFEPVEVPSTDFATKPNFELTPGERFFDQKVKITLATIANLLTRALTVKYTVCHKLSPVRINDDLKGLVKLALELISGHQTILLYGSSNPESQKVMGVLLSKFFNQADNLRILEFIREGKMFSDERFEKNQKEKEILLLMTGLFNLKPLYLQ